VEWLWESICAAVESFSGQSNKRNSQFYVRLKEVVGAYLARFAQDCGSFDGRERELIADLCQEVTVEGPSRDIVLLSLNSWARDDKAFGELLQVAQASREFRVRFLVLAWRVAARDHSITDIERGWIYRFNEAAGGAEEDFLLACIPYDRSECDSDRNLAQASELLGVAHGATPDQIKQRFRELSVEYHPDHHASAAPALRKLAARELAKLSEARDLLLNGAEITWYCKFPAVSSLSVATERAIVECFLCGQKCRLPHKPNFSTVRCPKCQALLLFNQEIGNVVLEFVNIQPAKVISGEGKSWVRWALDKATRSEIPSAALRDLASLPDGLGPGEAEKAVQEILRRHGVSTNPK